MNKLRNKRTFPALCPIIHFSPKEDGLSLNSIFVARFLKLQFYGTLVSVGINYFVSIMLVLAKKERIEILGSSFLSYVFHLNIISNKF